MSGIPTIAEAARADRGKQLSPVELTRACLDRVKVRRRTARVCADLTEERALAGARAAEAASWQRARWAAVWIPIGLKDIVDTKGIPPPAIRNCCRTTSRTPTPPAPRN